jgi:hypothetical protein
VVKKRAIWILDGALEFGYHESAISKTLKEKASPIGRLLIRKISITILGP